MTHYGELLSNLVPVIESDERHRVRAIYSFKKLYRIMLANKHLKSHKSEAVSIKRCVRDRGSWMK